MDKNGNPEQAKALGRMSLAFNIIAIITAIIIFLVYIIAIPVSVVSSASDSYSYSRSTSYSGSTSSYSYRYTYSYRYRYYYYGWDLLICVNFNTFLLMYINYIRKMSLIIVWFDYLNY